MNIGGLQNNQAAFQIADSSAGDATVTLAAGTANTLQSGDECAGLQKNGSFSSLTIRGNGRLTASGGDHGDGIGSECDYRTSNITLEDGTIEANGGDRASGIGGGYEGSASNITISGGTVTVTVYGNGDEGVGTGGTLQYSLDAGDGKTWSATVPTGTDAGTYTVYYKVQCDENHTDSSMGSMETTIAKAGQALTAGDVTLSYGDTERSISLTGSHYGDLSYTVADGTDVIEVDARGGITTLRAGAAKVSVAAAGDANHDGASTRSRSPSRLMTRQTTRRLRTTPSGSPSSSVPTSPRSRSPSPPTMARSTSPRPSPARRRPWRASPRPGRHHSRRGRPPREPHRGGAGLFSFGTTHLSRFSLVRAEAASEAPQSVITAGDGSATETVPAAGAPEAQATSRTSGGSMPRTSHASVPAAVLSGLGVAAMAAAAVIRRRGAAWGGRHFRR